HLPARLPPWRGLVAGGAAERRRPYPPPEPVRPAPARRGNRPGPDRQPGHPVQERRRVQEGAGGGLGLSPLAGLPRGSASRRETATRPCIMRGRSEGLLVVRE